MVQLWSAKNVLAGCLLMVLLFLNQCQGFAIFKQWIASRQLSSDRIPTAVTTGVSLTSSISNARQSFKIRLLPSESEEAQLLPLDPADAEHLAFLLANVSDAIETTPELALSLASRNMGFLFSRNIPELTNQLLGQYPVLREDQGMMKAYTFLLDFMETVSKELSVIMKENQDILKGLLEAAKSGNEKIMDKYINDNVEKLTSPGFFVYLDTEIENQDSNSPMENLLVTLKLRLLDECGKKMGVDVMILPKLAAEPDPVQLKEKTLAHLEKYDRGGKELFIQTLRIMQMEMKKRYQNVDPVLEGNLKEIEKIAMSDLANSKA